MTHPFGSARQRFIAALLITCLACAPAGTFADTASAATTAASATPREQINGPFAHAMCAMAFEFGTVTGKWDWAVLMCRIAQIIDPVDE